MIGRNRSLVLVVVCLATASIAFGGTINRRGTALPTQQTIYQIDSPAEGAAAFGIVDVRGYVVDPRGVSRMTLLVDGAAVHDVDINLPRGDVQRKYPSFKGEPFIFDAGFATSFLASNYSDGDHTLAMRVTFSNGQIETIGERTVRVDNAISAGPIGGIDSPRDPGTGVADSMSGMFPVVGWALDDTGIRHRLSPAGCNPVTNAQCKRLADIEVLIDGRVVGQAIYPLPRPDVANAHPDVAGAFNSGWQMNLDTSKLTNGRHTLAVRVWDIDDNATVLGAREIDIQNHQATLVPFGKIDWPMSNGRWFSTNCYYPAPPSGIEYEQGNHLDWVSGWVVDQNDIFTLKGIKNVELLLDGVIIKSTNLPQNEGGCFYYPPFLRDVNCYGYDRPDIAYQYPQFEADAKQSGFFFLIDTDYLLQRGFHRGLHYLSVRAVPIYGMPQIIDHLPIVIDCNDEGDTPSFGELELPTNMQDMRGSELLKGWVLDYNGSVRVLNVYVDGVLDGSLTAGIGVKLNMSRPDIEVKYPWLPYPYSRNLGFEYTLNTSNYVDGVHQIVLETIDGAGFRNYWVQRPVVFDNFN